MHCMVLRILLLICWDEIHAGSRKGPMRLVMIVMLQSLYKPLVNKVDTFCLEQVIELYK